MKKLIISKDKSRFMDINEVLEEFRVVAHQLFKKYNNCSEITEDDVQELDIAIFKAFQTYDEKHCFSTHLTWKVRRYITYRNRDIAKRLYYNGFTFSHLDFDMPEIDIQLHELIGDDSIDIEYNLLQNDFIRYLKNKSNEVEKGLIDVYLGYMTMRELGEQVGKSPTNISMSSAKFKKRLVGLVSRYDKTLIKSKI